MLAHTLTVKHDGTELNSTTSYNTMLGTLPLSFAIGRTDGKAVTETTISYKLNNSSDWSTVTAENGTANVNLQVVGSAILTVKCGTCQVTVQLNKVTWQDLLNTNKLTFTLKYDGGEQVETASYNPNDPTARQITLTLPKGIKGPLTFSLKFTIDNQLGGLDQDEMDEFFSITPDKWSDMYEVSASTREVILKLGDDFHYFLDEKVEFNCGNLVVTVLLNSSNITAVDLVGYNSSNTADIYLGYQQVRVFAKHSYYNGKQVDYFSVPVKVWQDAARKVPGRLEQLSWSLQSYKYDTAEPTVTTVASQKGSVVTYGGKTYDIQKINDEYVLFDSESGNVVSGFNGTNPQGITWVDAYSEAEQGNVRIYFGNFAGLSEVDVQNDYFGNFGEQSAWSPKATVSDDGSGRSFTPSGGAYSYLRVEANDGSESSDVSAHFNFNVLQDDSLVNVFDADGYYNNQNIVLHNDLYGNGELEPSLEATKKAQILDKEPQKDSNDQSYAKNTIYGNGYQANLNKLNDMIVGTGPTTSSGGMMNGGQENTGNATYFTSLYNVRLMGRNSNETINSASFAILFNVKNIYYTDLQNYSKMNPMGGSISIKNSVLHNVAVQALQLWNEASTPAATRGYWNAYLENVTIVNATKGISLEGSRESSDPNSRAHTVKIKGFLDALNYNNIPGLIGLIGKALGGGSGAVEALLPDLTKIIGSSITLGSTKFSEYFEWFGADMKTITMISNAGSNNKYSGYEDAFVNPVVVDTGIDGETKKMDSYGGLNGEPVGGLCGVVQQWDDKQQAYVNVENASSPKFVHPLYGNDLQNHLYGNGMITAYTYNYKNDTDGGHIDYNPSHNYYSHFELYVSRPEIEKLFSSDRYIRLLCQYLGVDGEGKLIRNDDHILWHMQRCYRDVSLIADREPDHVKAFIQSLENATKTVGSRAPIWDGKWPDGTTLQQALEAYRSHNS